MELTPGLSLIFKGLPRVVVPPTLAYLVCVQARLSTTFTLFACLLALPLWLKLRWIVWDIQQYRTRVALGAQSIPQWKGKLPFNIDLLVQMAHIKAYGHLGDGLDDSMVRFGNIFNTRFFRFDRIWTSDPRHIQLILAKDFEGYEKGPVFKDITGSLLGNGVFNADGEIWRFHRSMTRPHFTKDRISDFHIFEQFIDKGINLLNQRFDEGIPVDIQDVMNRIAMDSGTAYLFGSSVDSLSAGFEYPSYMNRPISEHHSDEFARSFLDAQQKLSIRLVAGRLWKFSEIFGDKVSPNRKLVNKFIDPILQKAISESKTSSHDEKPDNLLNYLISQSDDYNLLRDELLNILVAARDTTASLLTFVVYSLAMHPEVTVKLRNEIAERCGTDPPTFEDIKEMKYLRAVINETLRLFPPVPFNTRQTRKPTVWPSSKGEQPYFLPKGTVIAYSTFYMHRNPELWGPDAIHFDPERFLDERLHKYLTPNPFIFLPFNAGPRLCLGQQFAYNQVSYILIRLLQNFQSFSLALHANPPGTRPPEEWKQDSPGKRKAIERVFLKSHLTLYSYGGLWVTATRADTAS